MLFNNEHKVSIDDIADFLQVNPQLIKQFEDSYRKLAINEKSDENNLFEYNSREASDSHKATIKNDHTNTDNNSIGMLKKRIVDNLILSTVCAYPEQKYLPEANSDMILHPVTNEDLACVDSSIRPMCTESLMKVDISEPSCYQLISAWENMLKAENESVAKQLYNLFRQGLDILDLDPVTYEILGHNPNNMSYWLPKLAYANNKHDFFKIPETKIVKVPLPILQLTRIDFLSINRTTLDIVDSWAMKVFDLDVRKSYFIKTGTFSSKFDFRNVKVTGEKEVRELGEYLLFIQYQAQQMAAPLSSPCVYGVSTTNEWVVREFIEDIENNPTIYKGLPLHTEYRAFVDFDTKEILGISPYWHPDVMKKTFKKDSRSSVHNFHDYVIYKAHENTLMKRYEENKNRVVDEIKKLIPNIALTGQWSLDIMQNGSDFWLIDMAMAENSALAEYAAPGKIHKAGIKSVNWLEGIAKRLSE